MYRDGKVYHMAFARGVTTQKLTVIGDLKNKKHTGTLITFLPDPTIFNITTEFQFAKLGARLRELAFLNPGLEINLIDERSGGGEEGAVFLQTRHRGIRPPAGREQAARSPEADRPRGQAHGAISQQGSAGGRGRNVCAIS